MTNILILGNSHVGAFKEAQSAFNDIHPGIELSFFSVSEPYFGKGRTNKDGVYTPHGNATAREKVIFGSSHGTVDFSDYDHVLVVGLRTPQQFMSDVLDNHSVLEVADAAHGRVVTKSFVDALSRFQTQKTISRWSAILGKQFTGTIYAAPFPGISKLTAKGRVDRRARASLNLHQHSQAPWLYDQWRADLESQMSDLPATFLWQPVETVQGPFVTKAEYVAPDHIHMNEKFGLVLLENYVRKMNVV